MCSTHLQKKSQQKNACKKYAKFFSDFVLGSIPYDMKCTTILGDLSEIYNAPFVIALINSSFSFAAKLHKLDRYKCVLQSSATEDVSIPWAFDMSETIPHDEIDDYEDFDAVIEKHYT